MHILHLVHQYPPEYVGGTELYTQMLAQKFSQRGGRVGIITRINADGKVGRKVGRNAGRNASSGIEERSEGNFTIFCTKNGHFTPTKRFLTTFGDRTLTALFREAIDSFQPDVVAVQHLMGWPADLLSILVEREIPYVVHLHDFWWVCASTQLITIHSRQVCDGPNAWLNCVRCVIARSNTPLAWGAAPALWPLLTWRGKRLQTYLRQASLLVAPTHFTKHIHVEQGIPESKIQVLPWGVERPSVADMGQQNYENRAFGNREAGLPFRFLYVGGISWQKGIHVLIEAFQQVEGDCELWVIGDLNFDPAYSADLQAQATPNVRFFGQLSRPDVWQRFHAADIAVAPAIWYETFSLLVHEAYIAGCPVIASGHGTLAEVVQHEVSGLLVEPGNVAAWRAALQRCVNDPALVARLRQQLPTPLTVDEHVDKLDTLYHDLQNSIL